MKAYVRLTVLRLGEQFPFDKMTRSLLENICRKDTGRQRNYDVICHEYAEDSFVEQELGHLIRETTDSTKRAKGLYQLLKAKCSVKLQVELDQEILMVSLASNCPGPVIERKRDLYYSWRQPYGMLARRCRTHSRDTLTGEAGR